jgi:hypothetical protein
MATRKSPLVGWPQVLQILRDKLDGCTDDVELTVMAVARKGNRSIPIEVSENELRAVQWRYDKVLALLEIKLLAVKDGQPELLAEPAPT